MAPKQESLKEAEEVLADQMSKLRQKQAELKEVTDKLQGLNDNLALKQDEKAVSNNFILNTFTIFFSKFTCRGTLTYY